MKNKIINKENFINVCNESISMAQAAAALDMHFNTFQKYAKLFGIYKPNQGLKGANKKKLCYYNFNDVLKGKHPEYSRRRIKERLLKEGYKQWKCERCNNSSWLKGKIPLELNHINGIHTDNKLENLELLCPNCHAMTDTYRGKNKK